MKNVLRRLLIVLTIGLLLGSGTSLHAQCDTILKCPYLYYYGWPDTIDTSCALREIGTSFLVSPLCQELGVGMGEIREFALYQHTDRPLKAVGIAFGEREDTGLYNELNLYDSYMNVLANDTAEILYDWHWILYGGGSNDFVLFYPGMTGWRCEGMLLRKHYFSKPVEVIGDFYLGISFWQPNPYPNMMSFVESALENHSEPYHLEASRYRVYLDSLGWVDDTLPYNAIPELFLIIEPPCDSVDSIAVLSNAEGCVSISWEAKPKQDHWRVYCESVGRTIIDSVDTNHWEYCGLQPNTTYIISVQARCNFCGDWIWATNSAPIQILTPNDYTGIDDADGLHGLTLRPNPASDEVVVDCPAPITAVEAFDEKGACIMRRAQLNTNHYTLNTKPWPVGTYVVRVTTEQGTATRKLVVK